MLDKRMLRYFKDRKNATAVLIAFALGLILIFLGNGRESYTSESDMTIEDRLSSACSAVDGVGECTVFVYNSGGEESDAIESVIVICDGADSVEVRHRLTEMLSSFLGIGSHRIRVEKRK